MSEIMDKLDQPESAQFQEELAKIYFSTNPAKENKPHQTQPPAKKPNKKPTLINISLGLIIVLLATLFIFNRIEITVQVFPATKSGVADANRNPDRQNLSKGGEPNSDIIKDIMFYGDADIDSSWRNGLVIISNAVNSKKAILGINFAAPLDLIENLFCFYAKGKRGGEELRISLRDAKNNLCYSKINLLQSSWQQFAIDINQVRDFIDTRNIAHIDLELNPDEKQNVSRSTAYFKDLYLTKGRD